MGQIPRGGDPVILFLRCAADWMTARPWREEEALYRGDDPVTQLANAGWCSFVILMKFTILIFFLCPPLFWGLVFWDYVERKLATRRE